MACRSACPTHDHESWGACARAADIQIDGHALKFSTRAEKDKEHRLNRYASLRKHGIQPAQTTWDKVRDAEEHGGVAPTEVKKKVAA